MSNDISIEINVWSERTVWIWTVIQNKICVGTGESPDKDQAIKDATRFILENFIPKETPEELRTRLLEYLKSPDTKKLIDSLVSQVFKLEHPGVKYSHNFDIESLTLTIQTDYINPDSIRSDFAKKVPGGVSVEVNKL